jgi:diacylglycerol kinase (ATP)
MKQQKFSIKKRLKSFTYAFNGIRILFKNEHNMWIHFLAATCVVTAGFVFQISSFEWLAVILAIGFVFSAEAINSSIEQLSDFVSPEKHTMIKAVKDISAASVLISAITAFAVGVIVFAPKIILLFDNGKL